jgi:membrane peptidoglycan carboxypeptidase
VFSADPAGKARAVGHLVTMSAVGGVLVAAIMLPAVGTIGIITRNAANKFDSLSTQALGEVPERSVILNRYNRPIAYIYNVDASYYYGPGDVKPLLYDGVDRNPVGYDQIAHVMDQAIIAIEDDRYYEHGAIDFKGTIRALVNDLEHKPVQGGSTLAQQYVKNVLVLSAQTKEQQEAAISDTLDRKIHELRLAIAVEHHMSKNAILAGYLNDAYFGSDAVGIEVAANTYFDTSAYDLTLPEAALLAGVVENPTAYDPITNPSLSMKRRNTVLARMAQLGMISNATAVAAGNQPIRLHVTTPQNGCEAASVRSAAFFCDYAEQSVLRDTALGQTPMDRARLLATGGLRIYTTLDPQDQRAADNAVNYEVPPHNAAFNPGGNADTEAIVQPGTGYIRAITEDRTYGTGPGQTTIDYAVDTPYDGGSGIQSGSSSKLFTLITALEQDVPFGYTENVPYQETLTGFTDCSGVPTGPWQLNNAGLGDHGTYSLYTGTTLSINTFYAALERKVGLCDVVKTAAALGVHRANGLSLWANAPNQPPADEIPSFTLGSINVSPLTMAAAYASVASNGIYCAPVALTKIVNEAGATLQVPGAGCHRVMPTAIADAVNYILQGVLINGTAGGEGINRPAAGKTGTGNGPYYVDFAGYTPTLASYTSVYFPTDPETHPMIGLQACYRGGCPGTMFGANAPAQTWQMTFENANLGPPLAFTPVPPDSPLFRLGNGQTVKQSTPPTTKPGPGTSPGPFPTPGPPTTTPHQGRCRKHLVACLGSL